MLNNQKHTFIKPVVVLILLASGTWIWQQPGKQLEGDIQTQTIGFVDSQRYNRDETIRRADNEELRLQLSQIKKEMQAQIHAFSALSKLISDQSERRDEATTVSDKRSDPEINQDEFYPDQETFRQAESEQINQVVSTLEDHISSEVYDSEWQSQMQETIYRTIDASETEGSQLVNLVCHSSLCRLEFQHGSPNATVPFLNRLIMGSGLLNTEVYYHQEEQPDGNVAVKYYISREGHSLPTTGF